jgi:hypothetical protein
MDARLPSHIYDEPFSQDSGPSAGVRGPAVPYPHYSGANPSTSRRAHERESYC